MPDNITGKLKILIISHTAWDDSNSFGSSFSNIFGGNPNYEISNIYCDTGLPNTQVCSRFFQITEKGIIRSIISNGYKSGREIFVSGNSPESDGVVLNTEKEQSFVNKLKTIRWQIFFWLRDLIWATGRWRTKELNQFIKDIAPDLIILPIYYSTYINNIGIYAQKVSNVPIVGYISDDCYTLKQFSISPLFWIDRFIKRRYVKRSIDKCDILYVITEKQRTEYNAIFGNKCKVLYKGGDFEVYTHKKEKVADPIKFVYTGNLGEGRWKTLAKVANGIANVNHTVIKAQLYIYSQTFLPENVLQKLQIDGSSFFMGSIPSSNVKSVQKDADILVHVESFELSERYKARLSFSTKIVDYLEAARCILAIGWEHTGGIEYLKEKDAAIIVTEMKEIEHAIDDLARDPELIIKYANKAFICGKENHQSKIIRNDLYKTISSVISPVKSCFPLLVCLLSLSFSIA
jgi:hypothetical protein